MTAIGGRWAVEGRTYEPVEGFFKRPSRWTFVEVADVDVDADDNVYVFNRSAHPVMIFDKDGSFLDAWGEIGDLYFSLPHGLTVGPDGFVYTADAQDHTVRKWTNDGKLELVIGRPYQNAPEFQGSPFNQPTDVAVASNGDVYVSDGYGNAHIHCFSPGGDYRFSWGGHGTDPGEFNTVHSLCIDRDNDDRVYVADRFNNRIQWFSRSGDYLGQWSDFRLPNSICLGDDGTFYVAELDHRVSVVSANGEVLTRWGDEVEVDNTPIGGGETGDGRQLALPDAPSRDPMLRGKVRNDPGPGLFSAPHGIAVDSEGSIYVAEVAESWVGLDRGNRSVQKFVRA